MTQFGLLIFATDYSIDPQTLAQQAEMFGFESLFLTEHTHIPVSRKSPWPGGSELPKEYWHTHDPFVALAMAASVTQTLKLGTGISLVTERDPILMAKQVATLDHLSGGRVVLGIGAGWNAEEMEHHGTPFAKRWQILRERTLAMREIWSQEEAEFHGEFVDFDKIWSYPKPKQDGGPPILVGASSKFTYDRIAEYADGWMPIYQNHARRQASGGVDYADGMAKTNSAWQARGREGQPNFSIFGVGADRRAVSELVELGFDRVIFALPSDSADVVLPLVEKYAAIAHEFSS